ncbi:hypothetical protein ACXR2W_08245 [Leucobacter sp. HY1908]
MYDTRRHRAWVVRFERDGSSAVLFRVMDTLEVLGVSMNMEFGSVGDD